MSDPAFRGRRAAFLDRDGVINIDRGYVYRREDFEFVDGALPASAQLAARGFALVVVTNQSGIGRGMYSESDVERLNSWMVERFASVGAPLSGIYFCPHHPTEATGVYRIECDCRKPAPGMLLRAARELHLDLGQSVLFGDRRPDLEAGLAAGIPVRILLGTDGEQVPAPIEAPLCSARFRSLAEAVGSDDLWTRLEVTSHA